MNGEQAKIGQLVTQMPFLLDSLILPARDLRLLPNSEVGQEVDNETGCTESCKSVIISQYFRVPVFLIHNNMKPKLLLSVPIAVAITTS